MLAQIMDSINNHFHTRDKRRNIISEKGEFTIESGIIKPVTGRYIVGQYIRILGSILNDGIYQIESIRDGYIDVSINDNDYPLWKQPTGAADAYQIGDRVTHNKIRYKSLINANIWEPGSDPRWWEIVGEEEHSLHDETFTGIIAPLAIPRDFLRLTGEISAFQENAAKTPNTGVISESFSGYSYSKATTSTGIAAGWKEIYASQLNQYRKMFTERF